MKQACLIALALIAGLLLPPPARAMNIDASASGNWYIAGQPGHGLHIDVLDLSQAVVAFYTFDTGGRPLWLFGTGTIAGDTLRAELSQYAGTRFPPDFRPEDIRGRVWGEVIFRRTACARATVAWTPAEGAYLPAEFPLDQLTRVDGTECMAEPPWPEQRRFRPAPDDPGFQALFLDYPAGAGPHFELEAKLSPLPEPWSGQVGIRISGNNASDDLMMVLMRPVDGLLPNTSYALELQMQFATRVPSGCFGIGGSPGEAVYMRLGAAGQKPSARLVDGMRRASIDLGQQARAGEYALAAGNMANGADPSRCADHDWPWRLKRVDTRGQDFAVTSDENGRIWVYGLSDSGFEGTTTWYLTEFRVRLAALD